jgi:hypothetical protein
MVPSLYDDKNKNEYGKIIVSLRISNQEIIAELTGQDGDVLRIQNPHAVVPVKLTPDGRMEAVFPMWGLGHTKGQDIYVNLSSLTGYCICTNRDINAKFLEIMTGLEMAPPNMRFQPPPGSRGPGRDPEGARPGQIFDISGRPVKS